MSKNGPTEQARIEIINKKRILLGLAPISQPAIDTTQPIAALTQPVVTPQVKSVVIPEVKPVITTQVQPVVKPEVKPAITTQVQPVVKPEVKPVVIPEAKSVITPQAKSVVASQPNVTPVAKAIAQLEQSQKITLPPTKPPRSPIIKLTSPALAPKIAITSKTPVTTNPTTSVPLPPPLPPVIKTPVLTQQNTSAVTPPPFKITGLQFAQGKAGLKKVTTRESSPIIKTQSGPQPITPMMQVQATRVPSSQSKNTGVSMDELKAKLQSRLKL